MIDDGRGRHSPIGEAISAERMLDELMPAQPTSLSRTFCNWINTVWYAAK
jgi:hypothetical protein